MTDKNFETWETFANLSINNRIEVVDADIEKAEILLRDLKRQRKELADLQNIYEGATRKREDDQWCFYSNQVLGENRIKKLQDMTGEKLVGSLDEFAILAKHEADRCVGNLVTTLPEALSSAGLPLDDTSRFPRFSIKDSYLRIQINEKSLKAVVTPTNGKEIEVDADVASIMKLVENENERLFPNDFDASKFVKCLVATIKNLKAGRDLNLPSSISWKEILKNWDGPKIAPDELGAQFGMTMGSSPQLLSDNGIFFNQEKGSAGALKPHGQTLLIGTISIRNGDNRG